MRSGNNRCKYAKEVTCSNDRPVAVVVVQAHSYRRVASSGPESKAGTERVFLLLSGQQECALQDYIETHVAKLA